MLKNIAIIAGVNELNYYQLCWAAYNKNMVAW